MCVCVCVCVCVCACMCAERGLHRQHRHQCPARCLYDPVCGGGEKERRRSAEGRMFTLLSSEQCFVFIQMHSEFSFNHASDQFL